MCVTSAKAWVMDNTREIGELAATSVDGLAAPKHRRCCIRRQMGSQNYVAVNRGEARECQRSCQCVRAQKLSWSCESG